MKKFTTIMLTLVFLTTSSCARKPNDRSQSIESPQSIELETYQFKGHTYVGRSNFLVHDPDCKLCKERNQTKDDE